MSEAKKKKQNGGDDMVSMRENELSENKTKSVGKKGILRDLKGVSSSPGGDVVVLTPPAPVMVGEAVHLHVLVWGHGRHPTEVLRVRQPGRDRIADGQDL